MDVDNSDGLKGLNMSLPGTLTISNFTPARIKEIQAMKKAIKDTTGVKMAFQKLPKHMRRRTMAHNVKRLPRRIREIHLNQMKKSGLPPKTKRPSRKYRRRPYNLLEDYARRRRRVMWLKTHIWHAKRFHMIEKWGYKLPYRPSDKSFRACYRATNHHCLLEDISYNQCIEISGKYQDIVEQLMKVSDPKTGLTFGARCFYDGKKFGRVTVFEAVIEQIDSRKVIGEVEFLWKTQVEETAFRVLWIFVHPAFYSEFLNILLDLFELKPTNMEVDNKVDTPLYEGPRGIILKELQFEVSKLRLTGPLSTSVLKNALIVVNFKSMNEQLPGWSEKFSLDHFIQQNDLFKTISSTVISPNMVLSVIVHDPRLNFPKKRTKSWPNSSLEGADFEAYHQNLSVSPLWNEEVRSFIKDNKLSNEDICKMRNQLLVPGSDLETNGDIIPIILLWRMGCKSKRTVGYSSGWDIILPSSYAQSFFLAFYMWGGRAGGLRETESIAFEKSDCDILYPDTLAGECEEKLQSKECREKYFRLPPNKRTNYQKFAMVSPFCLNWRLLVKDWSGVESFFVLRDKNKLKNIQDFFTSKLKPTTLPSIPDYCLIPIQIFPVKKGLCNKFAIICIPKLGDYEKEPIESKCIDSFAKKRYQMRKDHKALLKRMKKRRKRAKALGKPIIQTDANLLRNYTIEMRKLWLPEPDTIRNSCSREIMGFVKQGGFSYTIGQAKGLGYIAAPSLKSLVSLKQRNRVLFRNTTSRQYRVGTLEVIVE